MVPLPKLTEGGSRIFFIKYREYPDTISADPMWKLSLMLRKHLEINKECLTKFQASKQNFEQENKKCINRVPNFQWTWY